jgi:hypothetical protein
MATALETAILAEINALPAGIVKELAKEKLTEYIAAKAASATASANDVISYQIAGRSVTRRNNSEFAAHVRALESEFAGYLSGCVSLIDMSAGEP